MDMRHSSGPFFQEFSSILFGRPALSGLQEKLREVAALNTLSDFFETFGFLIPDALLRRRSSGANSRQRRFTLHVTFWAFLAQTLAAETSCRDIVRKVQAWWLLRAPKSSAGSSSTAASTKARQRPPTPANARQRPPTPANARQRPPTPPTRNHTRHRRTPDRSSRKTRAALTALALALALAAGAGAGAGGRWNHRFDARHP
jgi:hypothetical protein